MILMKFTFKPDIASKITRTARSARTLAQLFEVDKIVTRKGGFEL